jgi:hypothetical protein
MIDYMQSTMADDDDSSEPELVAAQPAPPAGHLLLLSAAAINTTVIAPRTMQLLVHIQGHCFRFLVDSGSSSCFIDAQKAATLQGAVLLDSPVPIQVAGGMILHSTQYFPSLCWEADGVAFQDTFKVLNLSSYDGIIGLDWLGKYSPMVTHWEQGWIAIQHEGRHMILRGDGAPLYTHALVELQLLQEQPRAVPVV